ncbi:MAG: helicase-related protein [Candidatus Heimdallarchaeaceae archaeon]
MEKRDYQLSAVKEIIQAYPEKSVLLNYPYGTGKTIIALLSFLVIKKSNPDAKFLFTSAREAANLRCRQALEMAKDFGFIEKIGYLYDSTGKGVSLRQKSKMYEAATAIFSPITALMNDYLEIKTKLRIDILDNINLCVIDEATDILAREISGFRLSRYFESLFRYREKNGNFPILALTGTRDKQRTTAIFRLLGKDSLLMQRLDLSPYETITKIQKIRREDYIKLDQLLSTQISKPVETIQNLMDKNLSRLEIIKLSYGGILERLQKEPSSYPYKINKYQIESRETREELIIAFLRLFKLSHARLLLLESTPGEFLKYIEDKENKDLFKQVIDSSKEIISYRIDLPRYDNPTEKTTRGLVQPKVGAALDLIHEHLIRGAQVLVFTRYLALGEQIFRLLKTLHFPDVRYISGKTSEDVRKITLREFSEGNASVLIFTPLGGRGLNLDAADVVIHLDITTNIDDMIQRRERARGCMEYVLVLEETSEEKKVEEYQELIEKEEKKNETKE